MLATTYDLWAFVSENWRELLDGLGQHAQGLGDRDRRRVRDRARARRRPGAPVPVVSQFTAVYVEIIRNTPILVQIFMIFYALPQFGLR